MKYLLIALINAIYGILLFLSLSSDTPGYFIVFTLALVLTIIGLSGLAIWLKITLSANKEGPEKFILESWFKLTRSFDIVLVIGLIFRALVFQPFVVDGNSMEISFHDKEAIIVDKLSTELRTPKRGEVVVFRAPTNPQDDYIKRVVGLPGETVLIQDGKVYINNRMLDETYLPAGTFTSTMSSEETLEKKLGPNEYFVLGDNRDHSSDSREWGTLPKINIVGRAFVAVYPFENFGFVKIPSLNI